MRLIWRARPLNPSVRFSHSIRRRSNSRDPYFHREGDLSHLRANPSIFTDWNKVGRWSVAQITSKGLEGMGLHGPTPTGGNAAAGGVQTAGRDSEVDSRGGWDKLDYSPLPCEKSIRILTLHPGQDGEPLRMSLSHHVLSDGGRDSFSALSYAWGDPTDLQPVSCDGRTIGITKNLSACLKHIRLADVARMIWIDVICINQEDLEERASQVGIMGEIYAKAEKVLIWLGEGNEDTKNGVFALESMAKAWDPPIDEPVSFTTVLEFARASRIRRLDYWALGRQQYVRSISDSPWFTRAWTFQEVGLSSDAEVWIGSHHMAFKNLVYAWLVSLHHNFERTIFLNGYGRTTDTGRTCMHAMFAYWYLQNHGTPEEVREWCQLPRLLRLRQLHEASDPRDLVFSLISLSKTDRGEPLQANYRMPVEDVFTQFASKAILDGGDLSLLSESERKGSDPALPSWVPDWRCPPATTPLNALLPTAWREYSVGRGRPQESGRLNNISTPDGKGLRLPATHIDIVKESYAVNYAMLHVPAEMRNMDWSETAKGLWYYIRTRLGRDYDSTYLPTNEPLIVALLRTLSADNFPTSPALDPDEAAHRFPLHYSLVRHPQWLTLWGHVLRKLRVWDYQVPETHGLKLGLDADAMKHAVRAARGPDPPLPYLPSFFRKLIVRYSKSVGRCPYIGPSQRGNGTMDPEVLNKFYVKMLQTRMRRQWFSYVPYLPAWAQQRAKRWYKALGYVKLDLHRSELLLELMANVEKAIKGRRLISTEKGYLGLGALDVQPGDRVSILGNSPVPFLLRPRDGEPGTYGLVGECYVHGVMDGELWRGRHNGGRRADDETLQMVEINLV